MGTVQAEIQEGGGMSGQVLGEPGGKRGVREGWRNRNWKDKCKDGEEGRERVARSRGAWQWR